MARSGLLGLTAILITSSLAVPALAEPTGDDVAAAQALFEEGKRLMGEQKFAEACPKLVESQRLDPGGGTAFAIALCHESEGRTATAWADFNVALSDARKDHRADRESAALEHIHALEQKLSRVRIIVPQKIDGMDVKRDGSSVHEAEWGVSLPIDPGPHHFEASAPGKKAWHVDVNVNGDGKSVDVTIQALEADASKTPLPPPPIAPVLAPPPPEHAADTSSGSGTRTAGFVVGGISLVCLGVGSVFGLSASSKWHDAQTACPGNKCTNSADAQHALDAGHAADVSTGFFVVGGVGLAVGAALILFSPSDSSSSSPSRANLHVTPMIGQTNGLALSGSM